MVKLMIDIDEETDAMLSMVMDQQGFKTKSEAVEFIMDKYEEKFLEVRPEYLKKLKKIMEGEYHSEEEFEKELQKEG